MEENTLSHEDTKFIIIENYLARDHRLFIFLILLWETMAIQAIVVKNTNPLKHILNLFSFNLIQHLFIYWFLTGL